MARNWKEFNRAARKAFRYSDKILAEEFISGREITVGILGTRTLPVVEVIPKRAFYDFYAKYRDGQTKYKVPAPITRHLSDKARALGLAAYNALQCSDFSRIDMILSRDKRIYILEVNTIPGLTERSLLPKAAMADGITFSKLCIKLLQLAIKNKGKKV